MKKIGIIGGLSCESSAEYYLKIARKSNSYLGGNQTVPILMTSINSEKIIQAVHQNNWKRAANILSQEAKELERMGAHCVIIPCNTLHKVSDEVQAAISIPIIRVTDSVGHFLKKNAYKKVSLLGTRFTMEDVFYSNYLLHQFGVEIEIPEERDRKKLHQLIFDELCHGTMKLSSKLYLIDLCYRLQEAHQSQSIILGCSELPLLIQQEDVKINLVDSLEVHTIDIVKFACEKEEYYAAI